jgi:hypothetical protein
MQNQPVPISSKAQTGQNNKRWPHQATGLFEPKQRKIRSVFADVNIAPSRSLSE